MEFDELSSKVLRYALEVHRELWPGLLESAYENCLAYELNKAKIQFGTKKSAWIADTVWIYWWMIG